MKKVTLSLAIAILGVGSVAAPAAYANGDGDGHYRVPAYYRGHAPARIFYGYVPGQTTTFYSGYVPGYGYTRGSTTIYYNGYAPYPYGGGDWWWPRPAAPTASW